jgi:ubiquinone/menaquinone biosynthesis C-methylase UbiE
MSDNSRPVVVEANVRVHSQLADQYDTTEPHFRPENKAKVRARLEALVSRSGHERMLDFGCGTGFMLDLAKDLFDRLDGVDATRAMLDRVDLSSGNVSVHEGVVESVPFDDDTFNMVTAYSFLDHLESHTAALAEARRVLRPGGVLYVDLVPNRNFWDAIYRAHAQGGEHDAIVEREIGELVHHEEKLQAQFGIDPVDWRNAEPAKAGGKGFDPNELAADLVELGYVDVEIRQEWFLGQAVVMHGQSFEAAALIDDHLRRLLPVSSPLYKYLVVTASKP